MHDLGDEYSFETILDEMALAGYAGTELGPGKYPGRRRPSGGLRSRGSSSVRLVRLLCWTRRDPGEYVEKFQRHVDLLANGV